MGPDLFDSYAQVGPTAASEDLVSPLTMFLAEEEGQRRREWAAGQSLSCMAWWEAWTPVFCPVLGRLQPLVASSV